MTVGSVALFGMVCLIGAFLAQDARISKELSVMPTILFISFDYTKPVRRWLSAKVCFVTVCCFSGDFLMGFAGVLSCINRGYRALSVASQLIEIFPRALLLSSNV